MVKSWQSRDMDMHSASISVAMSIGASLPFPLDSMMDKASWKTHEFEVYDMFIIFISVTSGVCLWSWSVSDPES